MAETQEPEAVSEIEIDDLDGIAGGAHAITLDAEGGHGVVQVDHGRK